MSENGQTIVGPEVHFIYELVTAQVQFSIDLGAINRLETIF